MPLRLSELLERIRPAGTPGAPSEGEQQREEFDRRREIADIAAILAGFEEEADALITAANDSAAQLRRGAERQARRIRAAVPARIATEQAAAARAHEERDDAEQSSVGDRTALEVARLKTRAGVLIPELRDAALNTVWSIVPPESQSEVVP